MNHDDIFYLIERGQPEGQDPPVWWVGYSVEFGHQWTNDATKARKFPSRSAASKALDEISGVPGVHQPMGHVEEHAFIDTTKPKWRKIERFNFIGRSGLNRLRFVHEPGYPSLCEVAECTDAGIAAEMVKRWNGYEDAMLELDELRRRPRLARGGRGPR